MLGVSAVFVAAMTFLLIEASLVYYLLPRAPAWLRERKDVQVTISSLLVNGVVSALFMMGQYMVDLGTQPVRLMDIVLIAAIVVAFVVAWKRLNGFHRRLRADVTATGSGMPAPGRNLRRAA